MKKHTLFFILVLVSNACLADMTTNDYQKLNNKSGESSILETLNSIISDHNDVGYDGLYTVYQKSDSRADGSVWDMYSDCRFSHSGDRCGSYGRVCDCFNREHSVPQSWFSGSHMKSDAFHVYPTDGYVNNQRGNHPFGECANGTYLSSQARGKLGSSTFSGYSGTVFEPDDEYKGDFARSYFYMVACYYGNNMTKSDGSDMFTYTGNKAGLTDYAVRLLLKWHRQDPVSDKETARNDAVYSYQKNRNPFIDYPCLAEYIWGDKKGQKIDMATLGECKTTPGGTTPTDPPTPDPDQFRLLPVTDVHSSSVVLHWTDAKVSDYVVDVYEKTEAKDEVEQQTILLDSFDSKTSAKTAGYTSLTDETGAIRLGSGSATGSLTYSGLDLSHAGYVRVNAKSYGSDQDPTFTITVGEQKKQFTAGSSYEDYTFEFEGTEATTVVISTDQSKRRIYVSEVEVVAGALSSGIERVAGYPRSVGNVLQHKVEGLKEMTMYYYTVQPAGQQKSEEMPFFTEEGWAGFDFVPFPTLEVVSDYGQVIVRGLEQDSYVEVFTANGRLVAAMTTTDSEQLTLNLNSGLYLVRVIKGVRTESVKVIVR